MFQLDEAKFPLDDEDPFLDVLNGAFDGRLTVGKMKNLHNLQLLYFNLVCAPKSLKMSVSIAFMEGFSTNSSAVTHQGQSAHSLHSTNQRCQQNVFFGPWPKKRNEPTKKPSITKHDQNKKNTTTPPVSSHLP